MKNNKGIKVQSVVYPPKMLTFNEWAQTLNVSCMYDKPLKSSGHSYTPIKVEKGFMKKLMIRFGITK